MNQPTTQVTPCREVLDNLIVSQLFSRNSLPLTETEHALMFSQQPDSGTYNEAD